MQIRPRTSLAVEKGNTKTLFHIKCVTVRRHGCCKTLSGMQVDVARLCFFLIPASRAQRTDHWLHTH